MRCIAPSSWPISSWDFTAIWPLRSPPAIRSAAAMAWASGRVIERVIATARKIASATAIAPAAQTSRHKVSAAVSACWLAASETCVWWLSMSRMSR